MKLLHMQRDKKWSSETQFKNAREAIYYWAGVAILNQFAKKRIDFDVQWSGPVPSGPKIFAGNHPTTTDPFYMLTIVSEKIRMMVNADLFCKPVLGGLMRKSGHIPVDKTAGAKSLEAGLQALSRGDSLGIFPEGSLSDLNDGVGVNRLKTGAVRMAIQTGSPILPVGIHMPVENIRIRYLKVGGERVESRFLLKGRYAITIGQPMWITGSLEDWDRVRAFNNVLQERIYDLSQVSAMRLERGLPLEKGKKKKKKSVAIEPGM